MPRIRSILLGILQGLTEFLSLFFSGRPAITRYFLPKVEQRASVAFRRGMRQGARTPFARIENVRTRWRVLVPALPVMSVLLVLCLVLPVTAHGAVPDDVFFGLCARGTVQEVGRALASGADIGARDEQGTTALMHAAKNPDHRVVTLLLAAGAKPNVKNQRGETALMMVVESNSPETVRFFLDAGVDVNAKDMDGVTALMRAAASANPEVLKMLLASGVKVNARDRRNWTALMWAADGTSSPEAVRMLVSAGAHVNARSRDGETALMHALRRSNVEMVRGLLAAGANVNASDEKGTTPLMMAVENRSPEMALMLLNAGAHVNARNKDGETALIWAAVKNSGPETVGVLLKAGADVGAKTEKQATALMWAAGSSDLEVVKALLDAGADISAVDSEGHDALWYAQNRKSANGQIVDVLKKRASSAAHVWKLIAAFVAVAFLAVLALFGTRKTGTGRRLLTSLQWAFEQMKSLAARCRMPITKYRAGEKTSPPPCSGLTLTSNPAPSEGPVSADAFLELCQKGTAKEVRQALENGADANARDRKQWTALMWAVRSNAPNVVEVLLDAGAEVNARDGEGRTALMLAALNSGPAMVKTLLDSGADVNARSGNGWTALMLAVANHSRPEKVKALLNAGADVDVRNDLGETALSLAIGNGSGPEVIAALVRGGADGTGALMNAVRNNPVLPVVTALIQGGVDVNRKDEHSMTPLMWAVANNAPETVKALLDGGADVSVSNDMGESALSLAMGNGSEPAVIAALVRGGADGTGVLMNAVRNNTVLPVIAALIQGGADVNGRDEEGMTPLMWAVTNNAPEVVNVLLDAGANVDEREDSLGRTALMLAADREDSNPEVVKALLDAGANANVMDKYECTAEKYARNRNKVNWRVVQMLEEGHARYSSEMIRQIVHKELALRPAPANAGDRSSGDYVGRITSEFNGPLLSFGEKFWEYVKEKSQKARELLTDTSIKIVSVEYIDRFLCSPLTCSLLCMIIVGLRDSVGLKKFNDVHVDIRTQSNHNSRNTAQYIWENWQNNKVMDSVLAGILGSFGINIIVNETENHDRWLYVGFSSGEKIGVSLGSGVSYWKMNRVSEGYHFDFAAQPSEQVERLRNIIKNPRNYIIGKSQEGTNFNIKIQ